MDEKTRKTGIDAISAVPWGAHLCLFYQTKQNLFDILVPYFKAGLENNEFCMWVTSEPLSEKEAEEAMRKAVPNFVQYLERGQAEVVSHTEWYLKDGAFNPQRVLNACIDKLAQALAKGYDGIRVTGNMAWLEKEDWRKFTDYEEQVNNVIGKYHMLTLCSYCLGKCGVPEVVDVIKNNQFALIRREGKWILAGSAEYYRLQHDLSERKKELECLYGVTNIAERSGITLDELYQEVANLLPQGWQYPEITCAKITTSGKKFRTENYTETEWKQSSEIKVHGVRTGIVEVSYLEARPEIDEGPFLKEERLLINAVAGRLGDITERKRAEEEIRKSEKEYHTLFESMLNGFAYCKMLFDENNQPIDFIYLEVNDAFERLTGLRKEDVIEKKVTEAIPGIKEAHPELFSIYGKVALTGESTKFDIYFKPLEIWLTISVYSPQKGYFVTVFENITELKQAEESQEMTLRATRGRVLTPLQKRFAYSGFEGLDDQETIELLLSLAVPHRKCKQLTRKCIDQFKNLRGLLRASPEELEGVGLTPYCIWSIKFLHDLPEEFLKEKIIDKPIYRSPQEVFDYLYYSMRDLKKEVFKVIYLNSQNQIINIADLFEGTIESTLIHPREVIEAAIKHSAVRLVFIHNHPSGDPTPSKSDKQLTRDLVFIGSVTLIKVLDHIIIGENRYFSFADAGLIKKYEDDFLNIRIKRVLQANQHRH